MASERLADDRGGAALNGRPDLIGDALIEALRPIVVEIVREVVEEALQERIGQCKQWLTYGEAAERLGCTRDAVRMRVKRDRLVARRQGRRVYVSAESVDRLG